MKLDRIGALLVRITAAAFVLRGVTGLANLAFVYFRLHHAVESNATLKQTFQASVKNSLLSGMIALVCGVICWFASKWLGRLLASGLDETEPVTPGV